jgi:hypothetical protein
MSRAGLNTVLVMAGLVPAIHVFARREVEIVDARLKPGHDEPYRR